MPLPTPQFLVNYLPEGSPRLSQVTPPDSPLLPVLGTLPFRLPELCFPFFPSPHEVSACTWGVEAKANPGAPSAGLERKRLTFGAGLCAFNLRPKGTSPADQGKRE